MVDVGAKPLSRRRAVARGRVLMAPETARRLRELPKGDALAVAQLAGIMAAKRTSELIPLCHPLPLTHVEVELEPGDAAVEIAASVETTAQTGVEMEALTAVERRRAHGLRHGEGDRQGDDDRGRDARREDEGRGVRAAVLTISDRVSRGVADDTSGDALEELLRDDGYEVVAARRSRRGRRRSRPRSASSPTSLEPRAHDRRHGRRAARRHARGDAERARARGARHPRGAARATRSRRRRTASSRAASPGSSAAALVVNLPGSPGGCRDGYAVLRPALSARARPPRRHARPTTCRLMSQRRPLRRGSSRSSTRCSRCRSRTSARSSRPARCRPAHDLLLDHGRDGRRPLARDGAQPADRRRDRRERTRAPPAASSRPAR